MDLARALPPALAALAALAAPACKGRNARPTTITAADSPSPSALVASRPYALDVPKDYDPAHPAPLFLALHGYGAEPSEVGAKAWRVSSLLSEHGAFVAHPAGTPDGSGRRFWNATDACCDFERRGVDDVAYLVGVIDDAMARYRIDPKRVWVAGLSNGGFMAHRLACDRPDKIAAIVSLAGASWADPSSCTPSSPVSVLEIHGTADDIVLYDGGTRLKGHERFVYPSVDQTVAESAAKDGCTGSLAVAERRRFFDWNDPSAETEVSRWSGCPAGIDVELWKVPGARHIPVLSLVANEALVDWLERHPKTP